MSLTYTGLELAKEKASRERCILFYQQYETVDYNISYDDFTFYDFVSKEDFLNELKNFIDLKSDKFDSEVELWEIDDSLIYLKVDSWKNLYVVSFDDNINKVDFSKFENDIEEMIK